MNCEELWNLIASNLTSGGIEIRTLSKGSWFKALSDGKTVYIDKATENTPSCNIKSQRKVTKKDFLLVCSYYGRWIDGVVGIRHEVSRKSRNTAYIFSLIEEFKS